MTQQATSEQLLPRPPSDEEEVAHHWDYIYEPEAQPVIDHLLDRYVESLGVPSRRREHRLRDGRANGGYESRIGQRR